MRINAITMSTKRRRGLSRWRHDGHEEIYGGYYLEDEPRLQEEREHQRYIETQLMHKPLDDDWII